VLLESVVDPTGAGDAFAGGFLGHVARAGAADARTLRQAMVEGTVTASFTTESFGPERLVGLSESGIGERREVLARISAWPFA
jgi:sugar/nucleoside kinase (ribokinase family)